MPRFAHLPIVALTAKAMPEDRERCFEAGCTDFVAKPLDADRLLSVLRERLPRSGPRGVAGHAVQTG